MASDIDASLIPERLADLDQWICWQENERDGKATKVPIKPYHTNGTPNASATDPSHWRDLQSAIEFHESDRLRTEGIGFVFASETSIVGVDLDDCRDPTTDNLESWARDIVDRLDSYTEVSPSGTGVHVIVEGELPPGRNRRGDVEMYDEARFFTVTTDHVEGTPSTVARRQDALLGVHYEYVQSAPDGETSAVDLEEAIEGSENTVPSVDATSSGTDPGSDERSDDSGGDETVLGSDSGLYARHGLDYPDIDDPALEAALHGLSPSGLPSPLPATMEDIAGPGVGLDDEELLERAMASKSGDVIRALYEGHEDLWSGRDSRYPSQSEADMGLCFYLGFWTGGDPERMDRLFRDSGLMRGKWDSVHFANGATYGDVCIARTLLEVDDFYSPPEKPSESPDVPPSSPGSETGSTAESSSGSTAVAGVQAAEDAKRLATRVQEQQRELDEKQERIDELETQLRWYRTVLGVRGDPTVSDELTGTELTTPETTELSGDAEADSHVFSKQIDDEEAGVADRLRRWFS